MSIQAAARCSLASAQWQVNQSPPCSAHQPPVDCSLGCWASARGSWGVKGSALMYKGVDKNAACTAVLLARYARSTASLWLRARSPATATSGGGRSGQHGTCEPGGWVQRPTTQTRHRPPEDRTRRRRWRTRALTTLPGCSWRVRPSDRIGRKHTTWRPIVSGGNPRGPQGYGKYPACTSSTGEVRPERGKIDGKWEVTSWSPAGIFQAGRGYPRGGHPRVSLS